MMNRTQDMRREYQLQKLDESHVAGNPFTQFEKWWKEVQQSEVIESNAMTLATAGKDGRPSARMVLLKGFGEEGFSFFTNYESRKGQQLEENPFAALVFFWKELERQVRIEGSIQKLGAQECDEYFNSRPEGSKLGAWASPQSSVIRSREVLEKNLEKLEEKFGGKQVERPPHWGGYLLKPAYIEFWQGRPSRLHDRMRYSLQEDGGWKIERLAP